MHGLYMYLTFEYFAIKKFPLYMAFFDSITFLYLKHLQLVYYFFLLSRTHHFVFSHVICCIGVFSKYRERDTLHAAIAVKFNSNQSDNTYMCHRYTIIIFCLGTGGQFFLLKMAVSLCIIERNFISLLSFIRPSSF